MIHELKTEREYFVKVFSGIKNFEIRRNDRDFQIGDELLLKEYILAENKFTGRILHRKVDDILRGGQYGLEEGFCIMSISKI